MKQIQTIGFNSPHNISSVLEKITTLGVQRANRYKVQFTFPDGVSNPFAQSTDSVIATMVQLPQRSINYFSDSVGAFSPYWDVPLKTEFDDHFIINFLVDGRSNIRKFIDSWMGTIVGKVKDGESWTGNRGAIGENSTIGSYTGPISKNVDLLKSGINNTPGLASRIDLIPEKTDPTDGDPLDFMISLYQVWPKLILPSQFDTNANNIPLIMSVDFSYRYYRINQLNGSELI